MFTSLFSLYYVTGESTARGRGGGFWSENGYTLCPFCSIPFLVWFSRDHYGVYERIYRVNSK